MEANRICHADDDDADADSDGLNTVVCRFCLVPVLIKVSDDGAKDSGRDHGIAIEGEDGKHGK